MKTKKELEKMAQDHWNWVKGLLKTFPPDTVITIETVRYLYETATVHGYGHAVIDFEEEKNNHLLPLMPGIRHGG